MNDSLSRLSHYLVFPPFPFECPNYTKGKGQLAILVPVKIIPRGDGSVSIAWSCSLGELCENLHCRYSRPRMELLRRNQPKVVNRGVMKK